jgi:hypothetical protein
MNKLSGFIGSQSVGGGVETPKARPYSEDLIHDLLVQDACLYGFAHTAEIVIKWLLQDCNDFSRQPFLRKAAETLIAKQVEENNPQQANTKSLNQ